MFENFPVNFANFFKNIYFAICKQLLQSFSGYFKNIHTSISVENFLKARPDRDFEGILKLVLFAKA